MVIKTFSLEFKISEEIWWFLGLRLGVQWGERGGGGGGSVDFFLLCGSGVGLLGTLSV